MSVTTEERIKHKGFNLNECVSSPNAELVIDSNGEKTGMEQVNGLKNETESLADDDNMENVTEIKIMKTVKLNSDREVNITRRVLRSGSVSRDPANNNKLHGDLSMGGGSSVDEVKEEVKDDHVKSPAPKDTHRDEFTSQINLEYVDVRSDDEFGSGSHGQEVPVKRTRGRPRKLQISSETDAKEHKLICASSLKEEKTQTDDDRSYDENGNAELHEKEPKVKRKPGRPRKLQISSQPDESGSNTNSKLARTPDLNSQLSIDRLGLKPQHDKPSKTEENVNCRHGSTLITLDQSMTDSLDESSRPKRNCGGRAKRLESDGGNCKGRKMIRKRGRPPVKRTSGETDESDCKAKKSRKLRESPLESRHKNAIIDGERRIGENQNEGGRQSKSESKKMLSDRILQLLLAAGWTVQYRPRNGRPYSDAVYVNPEGKTHWSVTKAYKVYKEHLESSMSDPVNPTAGSSFSLLAEEDLQLLVRNTQKQRSDKGKQRPNWNVVSTKRIGQHTLHGRKTQKEKNRRKGCHGPNNIKRISVAARKIKREEKHNKKRCALSARSSLEDADKENGYVLFEGKRTILGWMIDSDIVPLNGKVQCMNCKMAEVRLEGIITKEGIRCNCCNEVFSVLDFEVHSGVKHNQPFKSLFLEGGDSLLQCFLKLWNKQSDSVLKGFHFVDFGGGDQNDDTCGICGDGGDLICCDGCPSTFHQNCLGIKNFPSGPWFCCYCSCKFCEKVEAANHEATNLSLLSRCCLCEEKYHEACIKQNGMMCGYRSSDSFCGKNCQELFEGLELLIGVKHPLPEGFSWTFLRRFELPCEVSDCDISEKIAYNAKLAVAFCVMDECFSPLVDHRSGVNLLENIVYNFGSNFHRLNYSSFLTAVLEKGDETIAVASIRIHGNQLAEMPFIGTRYMYRRQGMCRRLMSGIESALGSLEVEKLVIPAVPELMDTWTSGFGFKAVDESEKKAIKNLNLVVFPGVDMLEKSLVICH